MTLSQYLRSSDLPTSLQKTVKVKNLAADEFLFHQGDISTALYVVEIGRLRVVRYTHEGVAITLQVARAGGMVAAIAPFSERYTCSAICEVDATVLAYPKQEFAQALNDLPELTFVFAQQLAQTIDSLKNGLELRGIRSARGRILRYLQFVTQPGHRLIEFDRPLKDVANELGLAPEVFYRTLSILEGEGLIARQRRKIKLLTVNRDSNHRFTDMEAAR
ncbi:Crp/Fnr family transcriptional regulator [Synechococcus sp. PCC 7336]|uniref:Crp/Fnr family transcriptional regulator n=1 Tax=Synechococcus sp. PCC 7336 TaxID=195250 RepID=UPI000347C2E9|nr:Crp/Fnr family transcriptional regulator [Synechococcus sp. PCC 7336]